MICLISQIKGVGVFMTTIGELIRDNPFYEQGILIDRDYYKKRIPQEGLATPVTRNTRNHAILVTALLEGVKKVALIALVIIPSIYALGLGMGLSVMAAGAIAAITSTQPKIGDLHLVKEIKLQGDLLAALAEDQRVPYLAKVTSIDLFSKGIFAVLLRQIPQRFAYQLGGVSLFFVSYSLMQDIEKLLFWGLEVYANKQNEQRFRALNLAFV